VVWKEKMHWYQQRDQVLLWMIQGGEEMLGLESEERKERQELELEEELYGKKMTIQVEVWLLLVVLVLLMVLLQLLQ